MARWPEFSNLWVLGVGLSLMLFVGAAYYRQRERLREALAAQRASEARFRSLVMVVPVPMCVASADGRPDYVNRRFETVFGYAAEDLADFGSWWKKACPDPDQRSKASAHWREACATAVASGTSVPPAEYPLVCKDGRTAQVETRAEKVGDQCLLLFTDLSERRRGEEALRLAQQSEGLGAVTSGIAHDFNNLLSAMLGNLNLAQMKLTIGAASGPYLENMEGTIRKAVELTRQMAAYAGTGRLLVDAPGPPPLAPGLPETGPATFGDHKDRFHGKVLLVDDEPDLRFSFASLLQHLGFQVVAARDGHEALERFRPGEFTLVFMDLTMPRMDGQEAFLQMKARDPEVRVVLVSGYIEREALETLHGLRPAGFIQKPFSLQTLAEALEKVVG